jgi:hypothetical protein
MELGMYITPHQAIQRCIPYNVTSVIPTLKPLELFRYNLNTVSMPEPTAIKLGKTPWCKSFADDEELKQRYGSG